MSQLALDLPGTITSVLRGTNGLLIETVHRLGLVADEDRVLDVTYGLGSWWVRWRPPRLVGHDLYCLDGVDFRHLPEADRSVDVVTFDPTYVLMGGRDTTTVAGFVDRYGMRQPTTLAQLFGDIEAGLAEAYRVLVPAGRLLVKCQDFISSGRFVTGHHRVVSAALALGFEQADELVHYSGTGPQPPGRRQVHSRRAHSFLCIFVKPRRRP